MSKTRGCLACNKLSGHPADKCPERAAARRAWWIGELSKGRDPFAMEAEVMAERLPNFKGQNPEEVLAGERALIAELRDRLADERLRALEEAARAAESMIVGGRAWTDNQEIAARSLKAAADAIRALRDRGPDK